MSDSWVDSCPEGNGAGVHTCSWLFECKECDRINRSFQRSTVVTYPHRHDSRWTAVYAAAFDFCTVTYGDMLFGRVINGGFTSEIAGNIVRTLESVGCVADITLHIPTRFTNKWRLK